MRLFGFQVSTATPDVVDFLAARQVDLVLDVGANRGQFARQLRRRGYRGRIHSFEPIRSVHAELARLAARDERWTVSHCAVGAARGTAQINVSRNTVYSSLRSQTPMSAEFSARSAVVSREEVRIITLDEIDTSDASAVFLKIDTQGYEKDVLAGANSCLAKCVGVQLEVPVEHLYNDVWTFAEAIRCMDELGFTPAQFHTVNLLHDDAVSAIEFDGVFRRKRDLTLSACAVRSPSGTAQR
jgi:FkbM family methyltransferase